MLTLNTNNLWKMVSKDIMAPHEITDGSGIEILKKTR